MNDATIECSLNWLNKVIVPMAKYIVLNIYFIRESDVLSLSPLLMFLRES